MKRALFLSVFTTAMVINAALAQTVGAFRDESDKATKAISCLSPKNTPAGGGFGALYGCVQGRAQTAKWFINEDRGKPGKVEKIKVMWNDWTKNTSEGLHADKAEAENLARSAARMYAPALEAEILKAFGGTENHSWSTDQVRIQYTWEQGPAIAEHLLVFTPR